MIFDASDLTYYSDGQLQPLTLYTEKVSARVDVGMMNAFLTRLEAEALVRQPPAINRLAKGIVTVSLNDGATPEEIMDLVRRLNAAGLVRFAGPMFTTPSVRTAITDEIVVKFAGGVSRDRIQALAASAKLRILMENYPLPQCYLLGFTSESGANPLSVSRQLHHSNLVVYAHPNFLEWVEPPGGIDLDDEGAARLVSEQNAMLVYPKIFQQFDRLVTDHPFIHYGWEPLVQEDFEAQSILEGWTTRDDDPSGGQYYWGRVSDADYPALMGAGYEADGDKGWVARQHEAGDPDRWPDMEDSAEGYAQGMDTWLVYGPLDLSSSMLARLRFQGAFFAPSTETFGFYVSVDGENWDGYEERGIGEDRNLYYWYPKDWEPRRKGIYLDLSRLPVLGDLTGHDEVYVAFHFRSDDTVTPRNDQDDFSFYGTFLDNILVEHCSDPGAPDISLDPLSGRQWGLNNAGQSCGIQGLDMQVKGAWEFLEQIPGAIRPDAGESPVVVAVLDEGVDLAHEDLNLVPGFDATYEPEIDPVHEDSQGGAFPWDGHGTACAGIIGAKENGVGVVGVAPGVKIMPVRIAYSVEGEKGWVTTKTQLTAGLVWAAQNGAQILSNSWGGGLRSDVLEDGIRQAAAMGAVILFAAGNGDYDYPAYPSSMAEVISVGAMSPCGERKHPESCDGEWWWGSNYGRADASEGAQIDVMAPGVLNPTTDISGDGGYVRANAALGKSGNYMMTFNGTSSACPHAAGVAALMLAANPGMDRETVRDILNATARDIGDVGWDHETGHGLADAEAALRGVARISGDLRITATHLPAYVHIGGTFALDLTIENDGATGTEPFETQLFLSADSRVDGQDLLLWSGTTTIGALAAEQVLADVSVPGGLAHGPHNLIVFVDGQDTVQEREEDNNLWVHAVQVAYPPNLVVKPSTVDFGVVVVGSGGQKIVQIKNEGENVLAPLVISGISFSGHTVFDDPENLIPSTPLTLETNQYSQMWLYFNPESEGVFTGTATITSNDPDEPIKEIPLSGGAVAPQPVLALDNVPVDFGAVSTFGFFRILNSGNINLEWSLDTSGMPGWITRVEPISGMTEPGMATNVELNVSRDMMTAGDYGWDLPVSSNGGDGTVAISMRVPAQSLAVTPEALDFGAAAATAAVTLENTGANLLNWSIVDDFPAWLQAGPMSGALDPGAALAVDVVVNRSGLAEGLYSHTIQIGSDGGSAEVTVSMTVTLTGGGWSRTYGHGDTYAEYHTYGLDATADGGLVFTAESIFNGAGGYDFWVVRLDADGALLWERGLGGGSGDYAKTVVQTAGGHFVVAGESYSYRTGGSYCDAWIVKLTDGGIVDWQFTYGGAGTDSFADIRETFDTQGASTGYVAVGYTNSFGAGGRDCWVVKLGPQGAAEWQKTFGGAGDEFGRSIKPTPDGGFIVAGDTQSFGAGGRDVWLLKLTASGTVVWEKTLGGTGSETPYAVQVSDDGGYVLGASTSSFVSGAEDDGDYWVVKVDDTGQVVWQYSYGGTDDEAFRSLAKTDDGGYVMTGWTYSFGEPFLSSINNSAWVLKIDGAGAVEWQKVYSYPFEDGGETINAPDWAYAVVQTADGGYAVTGDAEWWSSDRNSDAWIFKVDAQGELGCGIGSDTDAVAHAGGSVVAGSGHAYTAADTTAVAQASGAVGYSAAPEVIVQCDSP